jgi:hypothetical protein
MMLPGILTTAFVVASTQHRMADLKLMNEGWI